MDTSEQYIKMCDCPEIQEKRKPEVEKMFDGRWHKEWELEIGDFIGVYSAYNLLEIEVKGSTIYDPYFYSRKEDSDIDISQVGFDEGDGYTAKKIVWLPRQDQIQEMMGWHIVKLFSFFFDFAHDSMVEENGIGNRPKENPMFNSMEQLWLAFYMLEKHGKVWNGEEWLKKQ